MKPYYEYAGITIYHGDCREVLPTLNVGSVDLVLTDPPYGMTDLDWDKQFPIQLMWNELERLGTATTAYIFTASQPFTSLLVCSRLQWFRSEWIWYKNAGSNFAVTQWHPMKEHESVLVFGAGVTTYNPILQTRANRIEAGYTNHSNTDKRLAYSGVAHNKGFTVQDGEMRCPSSVQRFNRERGLHPNQKPVRLMRYFLQTYSNETDLALDPFMGSGTTLRAAKDLNRRAIGIETEERYCEIAARRLSQEVMELSISE